MRNHFYFGPVVQEDILCSVCVAALRHSQQIFQSCWEDSVCQDINTLQGLMYILF